LQKNAVKEIFRILCVGTIVVFDSYFSWVKVLQILAFKKLLRPAIAVVAVVCCANYLATPVFAADYSACPASKDGMKGKAGCKSDSNEAAKAKSAVGIPNNFKDVVAFALDINPQIAFARNQYIEARAGVGVAEANNGIQLEGNTGAGVGSQGTTIVPLDSTLVQNPAFTSARRFIGSINAKKLLYDFGATESNISRAHELVEAQRLALQSKVNDVGYNIADAYLRVFQSRELAKLNEENITALEKIQDLVKANQSNGNGTIADVKRVEARLVDARAVSSDTIAELQTAIDSFRRLVKNDPGDLEPAPDLSSFIPATPERGIEILKQTSPHLMSVDATLRAANRELDSKKQSAKPQITLQSDTTLKVYTGTYWNNLDTQAIVSMNYKFMDGGLLQAQISQILARISQTEDLYRNDRDQAEADLRKFYTTIESARSKTESLESGVSASASARDLYTEQFSAGKRTLFELLDIQTSFFNAKRAAILNMFEERRATYSALQTLGLFVNAANGDKNPLIAKPSPTPANNSQNPSPEKKKTAAKAKPAKTPATAPAQP
jgi:outer membrane protein TolC